MICTHILQEEIPPMDRVQRFEALLKKTEVYSHFNVAAPKEIPTSPLKIDTIEPGLPKKNKETGSSADGGLVFLFFSAY